MLSPPELLRAHPIISRVYNRRHPDTKSLPPAPANANRLTASVGRIAVRTEKQGDVVVFLGSRVVEHDLSQGRQDVSISSSSLSIAPKPNLQMDSPRL